MNAREVLHLLFLNNPFQSISSMIIYITLEIN